jgi:hypothetical protein
LSLILTYYIFLIYRCRKDILEDPLGRRIFHARHILDTARLRSGFDAYYKRPATYDDAAYDQAFKSTPTNSENDDEDDEDYEPLLK